MNQHPLIFIFRTLGKLLSQNTVVVLTLSLIHISYDAGEPYEIDTETLEVVTPVGYSSEWEVALPKFINAFVNNWIFPLLRSTAHPFYDPDTGEVITVNFGGQVDLNGSSIGVPFLHVITWDREGDLKPTSILDEKGRRVAIRQAAHSICVTRNHILIFDTPFSLEAETILGFKRSRTQAPETVGWVVRRKDLTGNGDPAQARKFVLTKEWEHAFADYNDDDDVVTFYGATSPASDYSECLRKGDVVYRSGEPVDSSYYGMIPAPMDRGDCGRVVLDLKADVIEPKVLLTSHPQYNWQTALAAKPFANLPKEKNESIFWLSFGFADELTTKRNYQLYKNYKYRQVPLDQLPWEGMPCSLFRYDCTTLRIDDGYLFDKGLFASSPLFIPRSGSDGSADNGYILVTLCSDQASDVSLGDELWIFDAKNLAQGPICRLSEPRINFALTLHTEWTETVGPRQSRYLSLIHI